MINEFKGRNFFLSNFFMSDVHYMGLTYTSVEAAFQAAKTNNIEDKKYIATLPPNEAKRMGRSVKLIPGWDLAKDNIMLEILYTKFMTNPDLKAKLLATGTEHLIEGNTWHDNYWGDCHCEACKNIPGQNKLGILLERVRNDIKKI